MNSISAIAQMIRAAEEYADNRSDDRLREIEYYNGEMNDTPHEDGRSGMTTRDVRAQIKKVLPSLCRTLMGSDKLGEYEPVGPGDEGAAEQATDYLNFVLRNETDIDRHVEDAIHDALLHGNGILSAQYVERAKVETSEHTGLSEQALAIIVNDPDVEVLEHEAREELLEVTEDGQFQQIPVTLHDVTIKRTTVKGSVQIEAVPREEFLITGGTNIREASVAGRKRRDLTRSDLVSMGYDKETVWALATSSDDDSESDARRDYSFEDEKAAHKANETIDYWDVFVRYDADGDGIAELHRMCFGGSLNSKGLLHAEPVDEVTLYDLKIMSRPHQWEGIGLASDLMDIQRVKTVLLRQTLDNIYWMNNPQPVVDTKSVVDLEAVYTPEFGKPIEVKGGDVRQAVQFVQVPFVAASSFPMLEYLDGEAQERTGVTDAAGGLAPDALQNVTAKASAMMEQSGIGQVEHMARTLASGLRWFFRGVLKLTIRHHDAPRVVRLRKEWVQFDPRHWNADMDFSVNTGLGAGTRERDLQTMQFVMQLQRELLTAFGAANNPYVKPENLSNALERVVEAAGLRTPDLYFHTPSEEEIQALMQMKAQEKSPEQQKAEAEMQMRQAELQGQMALKQQEQQFKREMEQMKIQVQRAKDEAQAQGDIAVEEMKLQSDAERMAREDASKSAQWQAEQEFRRWETEQRLALERETASARLALDRDKLALEREKIALEGLKMQHAANVERLRQPKKGDK